MEETLIIEINKFLSNSGSSILILNKAIQLAEITGNENYRLLFSYHLNGLSNEEADSLAGSEVLKMFSSDRMKPKETFYLIGSISHLERQLHNCQRDIESYLLRAEEHVKNAPDKGYEKPNPYAVPQNAIQQGVFARIINDLRTRSSQFEEIISKIRNRVMLFVREVEKALYDKKRTKINNQIILKELFDLFQKQGIKASFDELQITTDIEPNELKKTLNYLINKKLIEESFQEYSIALKGIKEVEIINKMEQESPEQKRLRVLKTIYDLAEGDPSEIVLFNNIDQEVQLDYKRISGILQYLEQRNLIKIGGEWVQITSDGIDQIETLRNNPEKSTPYFPANIYYNTFNAPLTGINQGDNMAVFDQRNQKVNTQYNAAGDINFNAVQDKSEFIAELEKLKVEFLKVAKQEAIDGEIVTDAEYQLTKAIQQAQKTEPQKTTIIEHLKNAKQLVDGVTATTGLLTALTKAIEMASTIFN
jgi:hypothetical protein